METDQRAKKSAEQKRDLKDLDAKRKKRAGALDKEATDSLTSNKTKMSEEGLDPDKTRYLNKDVKETTGKYPGATFTAETPLSQHKDDKDDENITPRSELKDTQATTDASNSEARSGVELKGRTLYTMAEIDKEAKELALKKDYESYGNGKTKAIREQCRAEKQQVAYF